MTKRLKNHSPKRWEGEEILRPVKRRIYKKSKSIAELERLANKAAQEKYPDTPPQYLAPRRYRDDSANALTKCIVDYIRFQGGFAARINTQGQYDPRLKKWRHSGQRKGMPDIQATVNGYSLHVEVKINHDRLSDDQLKIKQEIEASGGFYFVAQNFTEFKAWFDYIFPG
jgi:hypothetical protein